MHVHTHIALVGAAVADTPANRGLRGFARACITIHTRIALDGANVADTRANRVLRDFTRACITVRTRIALDGADVSDTCANRGLRGFIRAVAFHVSSTRAGSSTNAHTYHAAISIRACGGYMYT